MAIARVLNKEDPRETNLIASAVAGGEAAIRTIVKQHNHRLFRLARSVLRDDLEAEDAVQEAYFHAFSNLGGFRQKASLSTWLSRIVLNECLQRLRAKRSRPSIATSNLIESEAMIIPFPHSSPQPVDPEKGVAQRELLRLVEQEVDKLPDDYTLVLVARTIEGMTIEETSELLSIRVETVKTRLFRARKLLKDAMLQHIDPLLMEAFPFLGRRCEEMADRVVLRLNLQKDYIREPF